MIIDDHNHPDWVGCNLDRFLANMEECGIDRTWLLTWEAPPDEYSPGAGVPAFGPGGPIPFARCLSYVERAPEKFVLGYAPDPRRPEAIDQLAAAIDIYGVRVYGELKLRMMYDNPDALRLFRFCGERGVPVLVHIDYEIQGRGAGKYPRPSWWYGGGIEAFGRAVEACPDTVFVGHGPGFWARISNDDKYDQAYYPDGEVVPGGLLVEMLRRYPHLYCDTSAGSGLNALKRDTAFGREFVLEFQDRILYGRDCFNNQHQEYLNSMGLDDSVLSKLYAGNAQKLVPLERGGQEGGQPTKEQT